ncbi:unnamed protein product [Calypogeia fissa]
MTIKIYDGMAGFTSTNRVLATLLEKGITDFEFVKVDIYAGDHKKPEHLQLQPFGMIPVVVDGSLTLFESRAIARFLAHKYEGQGTPLYGSSPKDKALVEVWLEVEAQNFHPVISVIVWEKVITLYYGNKTDEALLETNVEKLKKVLDVYEGQLSKSKYLAGDFFSLADLSHLPYTEYLVNSAKMGDLIDSRPHVKAWWDDISSRPAWKKVLEIAAEHLAAGKTTS